MLKKSRLGPFGFKISAIEKVPSDLIGVYAFWFRGRCIYIGQAKDQAVKERLWQHYKRCHNNALNMWIEAYQRDLQVCVMRVPYKKISGLERKLIRRHQPRANVVLK